MGSWTWVSANPVDQVDVHLVTEYTPSGQSRIDTDYSVFPRPGRWYHLAWQVDNARAEMRMFINGVQDRVVTNAALPASSSGATARLAYNGFNGLIDEVRISNIARYTSAFVPPSTPYSADANTAVDAAALQPALLLQPEERALYEALERVRATAEPQLDRREYAAGLRALAALRPAVDAFFDQVMVMADDPAVRGNRLALLARLRALFLRVADLSRLPG
jgi:hypothetical protein